MHEVEPTPRRCKPIVARVVVGIVLLIFIARWHSVRPLFVEGLQGQSPLSPVESFTSSPQEGVTRTPSVSGKGISTGKEKTRAPATKSTPLPSADEHSTSAPSADNEAPSKKSNKKTTATTDPAKEKTPAPAEKSTPLPSADEHSTSVPSAGKEAPSQKSSKKTDATTVPAPGKEKTRAPAKKNTPPSENERSTSVPSADKEAPSKKGNKKTTVLTPGPATESPATESPPSFSYYRPAPPGEPHFYVNNLRSACTEWKKGKPSVTFKAEFGMELIIALPYLYSLHTQCYETSVVSGPGTKSLYFFVQNHVSNANQERVVQLRFDCCSLAQIHVPELPKENYAPPPLKRHYQNNYFVFPKPLLVITNKYQTEWSSKPINFIPLDVLETLVDMLSPYYTIVYSRPTEDIIHDNSKLMQYGDKAMLAKKNGTYFVTDLWHSTRDRWGEAMGKELTFNLFQMWLYANTDKYISVQGGNSAVTSYMAGENGTVIVYSRAGNEFLHDSIATWYSNFSNATVVDVHDPVRLVWQVAHRYIPDAAVVARIKKELPRAPKMLLRLKGSHHIPEYVEV